MSIVFRLPYFEVMVVRLRCKEDQPELVMRQTAATKLPLVFFWCILISISCNNNKKDIVENSISTDYCLDALNYTGTPNVAKDRSSLAFSDQGAWFAYGLPSEPSCYGGFSGPFLMTQENGVWISEALSQLELTATNTGQLIDWNNFKVSQTSHAGHLEQVFINEQLNIVQTLVYSSSHSVLITTQMTNISDKTIELVPRWKGAVFLKGLQFKRQKDAVAITSDKSEADGIVQVFNDKVNSVITTDTTYSIELENFELKQGEEKQLVLTHSFILPEYNKEEEQLHIAEIAKAPHKLLERRKAEKQMQLEKLYNKLDTTWSDEVYKNLIAKSTLTLQNNWRISSGQLKYGGLFPSYHYSWFHGFWAWDSWKHSVALAYYDIPLAVEQIKSMYHYQTEEGFIPDCIFRDTATEKHNYRNTKPPLSGWSVWKVYEQSQDIDFMRELYPQIIRQHNWWYTYRDHDKDGICEYGSTDGSLIAAKWESGMDNAVRFDSAAILKNGVSAYSLDQESVDLNSYLFAEKKILIKMAKSLGKKEEAAVFSEQAEMLKNNIQDQFFDPVSGWFYDTPLDGNGFIQAMGCEGWIPLWAEVATQEQAEAVKINMMNPEYFNTSMPFQTLSAEHPEFNPDGGYWRGPNWLDQSYFGIIGLHNYGYHHEAYEASRKLMHNGEGVLKKGLPIRENYHPISGVGLEAKNFSWSAAHYILLLLNE